MTPTWLDRVLREIASLTVDQVVLRLIVVVMPVIAMCAASASSARWTPWLLVLVFVAALDCAVQPESNLGLLVIVVVAWHWTATVDDLRTPWTLAAALAVATFHVAMAASASVPPAGRWSAAMRIKWVRRFVVVAAITLVAWCGQVALAGTRLTGNGLLLFVSLVALTATALLLRAGSLSRR